MEPVMSMYATTEECFQARADYFKSQRDKLLAAAVALRKHGLFNDSKCAGKEVRADMAAMRVAIAEIEASK